VNDDRIDLTSADRTEYVGKHVLIGLTYLDRRGRVRHQEQLHGVVEEVFPLLSVRIKGRRDPFTVPPVARRAPPGVYRLGSSGEEVESPALLSEWTIFRRNAHAISIIRRHRSALLRRQRRRARRVR
jgi:hypothetical protein